MIPLPHAHPGMCRHRTGGRVTCGMTILHVTLQKGVAIVIKGIAEPIYRTHNAILHAAVHTGLTFAIAMDVLGNRGSSRKGPSGSNASPAPRPGGGAAASSAVASRGGSLPGWYGTSLCPTENRAQHLPGPLRLCAQRLPHLLAAPCAKKKDKGTVAHVAPSSGC